MKTIIKDSRNIIITNKDYTKTLSGVGCNHCCWPSEINVQMLHFKLYPL